ncbi:hypothetical protein [Streptomyces osmaniensis]
MEQPPRLPASHRPGLLFGRGIEFRKPGIVLVALGARIQQREGT